MLTPRFRAEQEPGGCSGKGAGSRAESPGDAGMRGSRAWARQGRANLGRMNRAVRLRCAPRPHGRPGEPGRGPRPRQDGEARLPPSAASSLGEGRTGEAQRGRALSSPPLARRVRPPSQRLGEVGTVTHRHTHTYIPPPGHRLMGGGPGVESWVFPSLALQENQTFLGDPGKCAGKGSNIGELRQGAKQKGASSKPGIRGGPPGPSS